MANQNVAPESNPELEWIKFREDTLGDDAYSSYDSSLMTRFKANPIVPIGAAATVGALVYGLYCFKVGNTKRSQTMMRTRVVAQGLTVFAMLGGMLYGGSNFNPPNSPAIKSEPK